MYGYSQKKDRAILPILKVVHRISTVIGRNMGEHVKKTREERQKEIFDAAIKVFLEKGYRNTTMEDVINETSLSKGGFYYHYSNTKDILLDIMKFGKYEFFEKNIELEKNLSKEEICDVLTRGILEKILDESPEKKLYLMFAYEILYDPDFEKIYLKLEKESFDVIDETLHGKLSGDAEKIKEKKLYLSRMVNALLFTQILFTDKSVFKNNPEKLYAIFYEIFSDLVK